MAPVPVRLRVRGVPVDFPFKPYPAQLALMDRLIKAVSSSTHALLESPTGSGKSLALLCSVLAWHRQHRAESAAAHQAALAAHAAATGATMATRGSSSALAAQQQQQSDLARLECQGGAVAVDEEPMVYDAFASNVGHEAYEAAAYNPFATSAASSDSAAAAAAAPSSSAADPAAASSASSAAAAAAAPSVPPPPKPPRIPKIFFASRTHSQLSQLVSELKSTVYRPGMSVLGSRAQYCIHPRVQAEDDRNEACKKLLDFNECRFHHNVPRLVNTPAIQPAISAMGGAEGAYSQSTLPSSSSSSSSSSAAAGKHVVWDIEELVAMGTRAHACPYFAARALAELSSTDLVILPYNYILDPLISRSIGLDLEGGIFIIDESHNVEDVSRAAASRECSLEHLRIAEAELQRVQDALEDASPRTKHFVESRRVVTAIIHWIQENAARIKPNQNGGSKFQGTEGEQLTLTGDECVSFLSSLGITGSTLKSLLKSLGDVVTKPADSEKDEPHLLGPAASVLEAWACAVEFVLSAEGKYVRDYRMVLKREREREAPAGRPSFRGGASSSEGSLVLCFWCLNPAVAFSRLAKDARSIILTSGTLSPLDSFASELGTPFPIRLEAPHVIDRAQILAHVISRGPSGRAINASYKHASDPAFHDELGAMLVRLVSVTPHGVLVFFPSYSLLDKVVARWRDAASSSAAGLPIWLQLLQHKVVVVEPKANAKKFEAAMDKFTRANNADSAAATAADKATKGRRASSAARASSSNKKPASTRKKRGGVIELEADEDDEEYLPAGAAAAAAASPSAAREADEDDLDALDDPSPSPPASSSSAAASASAALAAAAASGGAIPAKYRSRFSSSQTGGLFLAVARGKISEGIDFTDRAARAVVVIGIPFPSAGDAQIVEKKKHNDCNGARQKAAGIAGPEVISGQAWYNLQAFRSVNQALGRAIRHRYDYGAIYLVDERYLETRNQNALSKWIQPCLAHSGATVAGVNSNKPAMQTGVQPALPFETIVAQTQEFFARWTKNPPAPPGTVVANSGASSSAQSPSPAGSKKAISDFFSGGSLSAASASSPVPTRSPPAAAAIDVDDDDDQVQCIPSSAASSSAAAGKRPSQTETVRSTPAGSASAATSGAGANSATAAAGAPSKPRGSVKDMLAAAAASSSAAPSSAAALPPQPVAPVPPIPTHLALSCRRCAHGLAALPIVQPVVNAPPYQQTISSSYFVGLVDGASQQLNAPSAAAAVPNQVATMVCSAFALQPSEAGGFGWLGYPCALPAGLPSASAAGGPSVAAAQFWNLWVEADQLCYQPLRCSACQGFVGAQILVDRRDGSAQFEESVWIANALVTIKPVTMQPLLSSSDSSLDAAMLDSPPALTTAGVKHELVKLEQLVSSARPSLPLPLPREEGEQDLEQQQAQQAQLTSPHRPQAAAAATHASPSPSMSPPPPLESRMQIEERARNERILAAAAAVPHPRIGDKRKLGSSPAPKSAAGETGLFDITNLPSSSASSSSAAALCSPPPLSKKPKKVSAAAVIAAAAASAAAVTPRALAAAAAAASSSSSSRSCIAVDDLDDDFMSTPPTVAHAAASSAAPAAHAAPAAAAASSVARSPVVSKSKPDSVPATKRPLPAVIRASSKAAASGWTTTHSSSHKKGAPRSFV